jgi:hypothetical protein
VAPAFPERLVDYFGGEDEDEGAVGVIDIGFADDDLLTFVNIDAGADDAVLRTATFDPELEVKVKIVDADSRFFSFGRDPDRVRSKGIGRQLSGIR